jgi:hypothetical protein
VLLVKGRLKRGLYLDLGSRVSRRIGSFSLSRSREGEGDEANGLRVRIGMFLVLQLRLATDGQVGLGGVARATGQRCNVMW